MKKGITQELKILHLEDTPTDAELVDRELRKDNIIFQSKVVSTKTDYVSSLKDFSPDIILSDHSLVSFDSREAFDILKASGLKIPFVLVTATISEEYAVEIMKDGAYDYVLKCSHLFNVLDTRGAIGVTERAFFFQRMRNMTRNVAKAFAAQREALGKLLIMPMRS